jgi:pyruvate dehydrogenase E1 component
LLTASTVPCCLAYDPAFHYEIATIVRDGMRRMYENDEDVFYYLALYNENYEMPDMPEGVEEGILRGLYRYRRVEAGDRPRVNLFGSGVLLQQALAAADRLGEDYGVAADVWSVTSYSELRRDALAAERRARLNPDKPAPESWLQRQLSDEGDEVPVVAVTDSMKAVADQVGRFVRQPWAVLGTDGFGRSDTRENLRRYFEIDSDSILYAALVELARAGRLPMERVLEARDGLGIDQDGLDPATTDEVRPSKRRGKGTERDDKLATRK